MSKGKTNIQGIYPLWRKWEKWDALRIIVRPPDGNQKTISAKIFPLLKTINDVLEKYGLRKETALDHPEVKPLFDQLSQALKQEYLLPYYRTLETLDLKRKGFNFEESIEEFEVYKTRHSVSHRYRNRIEKFWLPFFIGKHGCEHPRDFIKFQDEAEFHLRTTKTSRGKLYSPAAYNTKTTPLNEYMRYLLKKRVIEEKQFFVLDYKLTLEERKRRVSVPTRTTDTYSLSELIDIKNKIDANFSEIGLDLEWKLKAYAIFLGCYCMGLRIGNVLGMPADNLQPHDEIPHAQLKDNVVSGWSRGLRGDLRIENATKTSHDDNVKIPFVLPSVEICQEVSGFIKEHTEPTSTLLTCSSGVPSRWWRKIAKKCGFRYIHPHGGKHGFATIGAANLNLFKNNPYLLQYCCLHRDYRTTQKYINQKSNEVLKLFKR